MSCLKFLEVDDCFNLKEGLFGIEHLRRLTWFQWTHIDCDPGFADFSPLKSLRVLELKGGVILTGSNHLKLSKLSQELSIPNGQS